MIKKLRVSDFDVELIFFEANCIEIGSYTTAYWLCFKKYCK